MKLVNFLFKGEKNVGALVDDGVCSFKSISDKYSISMLEFIEQIHELSPEVSKFIDSNPEVIPLSEIEFLPVIERPGKVLAVGLNYRDHAKETGMDLPEVPMIFTKQSTSVLGHQGEIHKPKVSDAVDYEGEMAFVIGKKCRHVSKEEALDVIAGVTICNDVSVRDWQIASPTFTMGKSFDTHCPIGPYIVTMDEISDIHNLKIKTYVNDELRQDSCTDQLIFDCFDLIEHITKAFTLEPGDIIATGTSSGVGVVLGKYLIPNDVVRIELENVGTLENKVILEP
jgi:2-keto-4-pentenoate hydratase/2-oxohepta-3-ene-1,7-dioic acid hydratase in catechol pathway|uniref:Predicted 2-keto-4-pentenoate hydratase/2-oxohepta-3-ene-1,7-dioic acid hydratase n=1 Tax=uncultured bacterium MedeBAC49C08 TaxID=332274 RepID=Q4PK72_9BACT|nr:predicted 2-keto-4-pentenoate hydratase/2-oxohepta-3-ene-1,7-dioic acid hydratase [uncultured bacterium MedeBAC49C08]